MNKIRSRLKPTSYKEINDIIIIELINEDHPDGFKYLYHKYYDWLCLAAFTIVKTKSDVEDVVQEVFMEVWKKKDQLKVEFSFKYYLRRAVINRSLNFVKREKKKFDSVNEIMDLESREISVLENLESLELENQIKEAIDNLPDRRKEVFKLSRYDELSYKEIAKELNISIKTVENQISAALKTLRIILK